MRFDPAAMTEVDVDDVDEAVAAVVLLLRAA